ncbi:MAG TPA: hypothetical protein VG986_01425 [Pseudolabrys sp.]|nr:hypothetical protein [Pseudolabrys sp.]
MRPPRAGVQVGSLYFVRERPTAEITKPANLESLCDVNLAVYGVKASPGESVADIDLQNNLDASGALSGIQTTLVKVGLSGSFSDYFTYKLTNAKRSYISYNDAEKIFNARAFRKDCASWRGNIAGQNWGIYQILSVTTGDIDFQRKNTGSLDADASVRLKAVEPAIKASIKNDAHMNYSGKGVVLTFGPIVRNATN